MRSLARPTDDRGLELSAGSTFGLCISRVRSAELKSRLESVRSAVEFAAEEYDRMAIVGDLHLINAMSTIGGVVATSEMVKVYTNGMLPHTHPARLAYERIKNATAYNRCPMCDIHKVGGLDHHLPKAHFPVFAVSPTNLVPCCHWCQDKKDQFYPTAGGEQIMHPYFDNFQDELWLGAEIVQKPVAGFVFDVYPPESWTSIRKARASKHLEVLHLRQLYSMHAADEVASNAPTWQRLLDNDGAEAVRLTLKEKAIDQQAYRMNSWRTATYVAGANSDWFCSGGFLSITA